MKASIAYSLLAIESATVLGQNVIQYPFQKVRQLKSPELRKRATVPVTLGNEQVLYYANVSVGTPGQPIQMQVDTGSSDVWMSDSTAAFCRQNTYNCQGGTFTPSRSSTYNQLATIFNITYVDGTGSTGRYFTDNIGVGGITLNGLEMGLATNTTVGTGIMGLGYALNEAVCNVAGPCPTYPTIVEQMVSQKKINTRAYSLWLDDLQAQTGSILFGGVDTAKYHAPLISLPIERDQYSGLFTSFSVAFTGFTITKNGGTPTGGFTAAGYNQQAILDSGTSLTLLPNALFAQIQRQVAAQYNSQVGVYLADCAVGATNATFDFAFGGTGGPVIHVPINEFFIPLVDNNGRQATFSNGKAACEFGIEPADNAPILFGDTFLRSAYVVYDLDNNIVSLANTNFNATGSNVQEIVSGTAGVPGVSSTATGGVGSATYTSNPFPGGGSAGQSVRTSAYGTSAVPTGALITQNGVVSGTAAAAGASSTARSSGSAARATGAVGAGALLGMGVGLAALL